MSDKPKDLAKQFEDGIATCYMLAGWVAATAREPSVSTCNHLQSCIRELVTLLRCLQKTSEESS